MMFDRTGDRAREFHGYRIADQTTDLHEVNAFPRRNELIVAGEPLQKRSFTKCKCSVLVRVAETAIPETVELRGNCR